jgi:NDP-sugar pyrophosphorylase family protein
MLPVAILAGGLATRMHPVTEKIPKALIELAGRPFIHRQLEYLRGQGIHRVVLCTGYRADQIEAAVGNGESFGLDVRHSPDGPVLLGTGGALRHALPLLGNAFFVLYGDAFLPCDFHEVERAFTDSTQPALMTVFRNSNQWDKSNVVYSDGVVVEYNKRSPRSDMQFIDYGLGILTAKALSSYPPDEPFDLADVYHELSVEGKLAGCEVHERFYEIGSFEGLKEAEAYFLKKETA